MRNSLLLQEALCFDDVLLVPQYSDIISRSDVDTSTSLGNKELCIEMKIPVISANMDTITGGTMYSMMRAMGGYGIVHRFMSLKERMDVARQHHAAMSIGVGADELEAAKLFVEECEVRHLCIDVAHGDHKSVYDQLYELRKLYDNKHVLITAGNVCTYDATKSLMEEGADIVKVGIGPGAVCSTRIVTGHGYPQLSAIAICAQVGVPIIADGGIRNSGDAVKALAAGAKAVMTGSLFAGCNETPGETIHTPEGSFKQYRGMASTEAQENRPDKKQQPRLAEGVAFNVPAKGFAANVLHKLGQGIQGGFSYSGARTLDELHQKAQFVKVSANSLYESHPRPK